MGFDGDIRRRVSFRSPMCLIDLKGKKGGKNKYVSGGLRRESCWSCQQGMEVRSSTTIRINHAYHHGFDFLKILKLIFLYLG